LRAKLDCISVSPSRDCEEASVKIHDDFVQASLVDDSPYGPEYLNVNFAEIIQGFAQRIRRCNSPLDHGFTSGLYGQVAVYQHSEGGRSLALATSQC
jgi:hypothetical protein